MFLILRTPEGIRLLRENRIVPVSATYLEHLCQEAKIALVIGEVASCPQRLAMDAIEEALGRISHEIAAAESLKKGLLRHFLASEPPTTGQAA